MPDTQEGLEWTLDKTSHRNKLIRRWKRSNKECHSTTGFGFSTVEGNVFRADRTSNDPCKANIWWDVCFHAQPWPLVLSFFCLIILISSITETTECLFLERSSLSTFNSGLRVFPIVIENVVWLYSTLRTLKYLIQTICFLKTRYPLLVWKAAVMKYHQVCGL